MSWTREQVTLLIEEYKKWPNLYKVKSINYKNRNKRREALDAILNALKSVKQDVTIQDLQSRFQALKQNAQREKRKCFESHRSGAGTDEILEPSLWYYKLIQFIFDDEQPRPAVDSLQGVAHHDPDEEQQQMDKDTQGEMYDALVSHDGSLMFEDSEHAIPPSASPSSSALASPTPSSGVAGPSWFRSAATTPSVSGPKRKKRKLTPNFTEDGILDQVAKSLSSISAAIEQPHPSVSLQQAGLSSASRNFSDYVAAKLDRITDEEVRDEAEAEIISCLNKALKKSRDMQKK